MLLYFYILLVGTICGFLLGLLYWRKELDVSYRKGRRDARQMLESEIADRKAHELALLAQVDELNGHIAWYRDKSIFGEEAGNVYEVTFEGRDRTVDGKELPESGAGPETSVQQ